MEAAKNRLPEDFLKRICDDICRYSYIDPENFNKYDVKRGLRNKDGTGVLAGMTNICNVHGYLMNEGERMPVHGELTYRGINIKDIIEGCWAEDRFGFEETVFLLLFGHLPTQEQLEEFCTVIAACRELPERFTEDTIIPSPSRDIMNKLARSVLTLYSYDDNPDDVTLENVVRQSIELIARLPIISVYAYQVKKNHYDRKSMVIHFPQEKLSMAENILYTLRADRRYTREEAMLLDLCLMVHAEHGGGNNSTFATRVLTSSGTDTYSAIAAAIGSLKGPRHGGANRKVLQMFEFIKRDVKDWKDEDEIADYLCKLVRREAGDKSGLIYGMGHAVYTLSDPRAVMLKQSAAKLAAKKNMLEEFELMTTVERLAPAVFAKYKNDTKIISANVDMYSGFVYQMLDIPPELYTPLFAIARISGWCAHRIEELIYGNRIIRPAYKSVTGHLPYTPLKERK